MRTLCVIAMIAGCSSASVFAQLGHANLDGLQVDARLLSRHGDTRDLDCSLGMELRGEKVAAARGISSVRVLHAVDDTGRDLRKTNGQSALLFPSLPVQRTTTGFWLVLDLKSPAASAKCIRRLECEADLSADPTNKTQAMLRFSVENIRLPWVDPPNMQVLVGSPGSYTAIPKDPLECPVLLTFVGGRIPTAAGMRELRIQRAEDEDGRAMAVRYSTWRPSDLPPMFSRLQPSSDSKQYKDGKGIVTSAGSYIEKLLMLKAEARKPTKLRFLQGEAELCFPSVANGGLVEFNDFVRKPGEALHSAALEKSKVKLTFVGRDNFATRKQEWQKNRPTFISVLPQTPMPTNVTDSLQFTLDDPEKRVFTLEFLNAKGETLRELITMISTRTLSLTEPRSVVYTFTNSPPEGTRLRVYLAAPAAMETVSFKVENVSL